MISVFSELDTVRKRWSQLGGWHTLALALFLALLVWVLFGDAANAYFVSDDWNHLNNPGWAFGHQGFLRPLPTWVLVQSYQLFGLDALPFHLVSFLLYALLCLFIYFVCYLLSAKHLLSALLAIVFAVYPPHAENVLWIAAQGSLWAAFMMTASLGAALLPNDKLGYTLSFILAAVALCCKEDVTVLPFGLALIWFSRLRGRSRHLSIVPFLLLQATYLGLLYRRGVGFSTYSLHLGSSPLLQTAAAWARQLVRYYAALVDPQWWLGENRLLIGGFVFALLIYLLLRHRSLWPLIVLVLLAPFPFMPLGTSCVGLHHPRYMLVPSLTFYILLAPILGPVEGSSRSAMLLVVAAAILIATFLPTVANRVDDMERAGQLTRSILAETQRIVPDPPTDEGLWYVGLPASSGSAYVFKNGIEQAVRLSYSDEDIYVVSSDKDPQEEGWIVLRHKDGQLQRE